MCEVWINYESVTVMVIMVFIDFVGILTLPYAVGSGQAILAIDANITRFTIFALSGRSFIVSVGRPIVSALPWVVSSFRVTVCQVGLSSSRKSFPLGRSRVEGLEFGLNTGSCQGRGVVSL